MDGEPLPARVPLLPGRYRRLALSVAAGVAVVALYVWDDAVLAAPIVAASAWLGSGLAFVLLAPVFFVLSSLLAVAAVRAHDKVTGGGTSRLEAWLRHQVEDRRGGLTRRVSRAGGLLGFVASSVLLGGTVTTWLIRYGGRREGLLKVACASSAINAVSFVGMYSGLASLVF